MAFFVSYLKMRSSIHIVFSSTAAINVAQYKQGPRTRLTPSEGHPKLLWSSKVASLVTVPVRGEIAELSTICKNILNGCDGDPATN